jgi:hypothetical protein
MTIDVSAGTRHRDDRAAGRRLRRARGLDLLGALDRRSLVFVKSFTRRRFFND